MVEIKKWVQKLGTHYDELAELQADGVALDDECLASLRPSVPKTNSIIGVGLVFPIPL